VRPQKQRYQGRGDGEFGDCHRTCIAMILNMRRDDVPHFMDGMSSETPPDDPAWTRCEDEEIAWLSKRGLTAVNVAFPSENDVATLIEMMSNLAHGAPFILGGTASNGAHHSVVVHEGVIYNPNDNAPLTGPQQNGYWWLTIYSVGPNWRSPRLMDRMREWFR
jgi:hypothetical protein